MEKKTKCQFDLNMHTARLLMAEPFFAALSRRVNKTKSSAIPTAGVRVNPDTAQFEMLYNPEFFEKLPDKQRLGVLKHEFYHLVFEHVTNRKPDEVNAKKWNFATDLAINSHLIGELPETALMPGEGHFESYPRGLSAEAYLALLDEEEDDKLDETGDSEQFDDHGEWGSEDATATEIAKERLKESVKDAVDEVGGTSRGWGSVPADCRRDILAKLKTSVDWRNVLRYFIKTSQRANRSSTIKRLNKRYRYIHPGKKVNRRAKIAISIDQSGSVSDDMLEAFFGELNKLSKLASFTVVPFDTRVEEGLVYEWKQGEKRKTSRAMHGGTDFNAPTEYVNKQGFDGHIVLTDLMAPKPKASKCQRMWMTTAYYAQRPYFKTNERVIAITI
jgi:predicted metal-dependent peptidase